MGGRGALRANMDGCSEMKSVPSPAQPVMTEFGVKMPEREFEVSNRFRVYYEKSKTSRETNKSLIIRCIVSNAYTKKI